MWYHIFPLKSFIWLFYTLFKGLFCSLLDIHNFPIIFLVQAYMKLDYSKTGSVPLVDIEKCYCARRHPQVLAGIYNARSSS